MSDVRFAIRVLWKHPGLNAVAIAVLAIGIAANTAIFSVVNGVLLRPLPYPDAEELVVVWQDYRGRGGPRDEWGSPGTFLDWRAQNEVFTGIAAVNTWVPTLTGLGEPERLFGESASSDYFAVLKATPLAGRLLTADDDRPGAAPVAVISEGLWDRRFGRDPSVIGRAIVLSGVPTTVVGIVPVSFRPAVADAAEIWKSLQLNPASAPRGMVYLRVVARLRPGTSLEQASTAMATVARRLDEQYPETNQGVGVWVQPLHDWQVGDLRKPLLMLGGAVGFVLLIACANIANLLLARASGREGEIAMRMALGASRGRLVRLLLTESVVLAAAGGMLGVLLAVWGLESLIALAPAGTPRLDEIRIDMRVLGFATTLTLVTGVAFGLAPALRFSRPDLAAPLKDGARGTTGRARGVRNALVVAEVAVSLVLLIGAGLFIRSFVQLQSVDPGFDPDRVLRAQVVLPRARYPERAHVVSFHDRLLERLAAVPRVDTAAVSSIVPMGDGDNDTSFMIEGRPDSADPAARTIAWYRQVSPDFFRTMGVPIRRGRGFSAADGPEGQPVVVINETMAHRFWDGEDPIGKRIRTESSGPWITIVGVAGDVRSRGLDRAPLVEMFLPYRQAPDRGLNVLLKSSGDPRALAGQLRTEIRQLDPDLPLAGVATLGDLVAASVAQPRLYMLLLSVFAGVALVLAAVGIYGVVAYGVTQRVAEIGIRVALGADRRDVLRLVIGDSMRLVFTGIALGVAGAAALARAVSSLLFGVTATDPVAFGLTAGLLAAVALAACYLPARRALRLDPVSALRAN